MSMSSVVEHTGASASTDARHHIGHHGAQSCPRYNTGCFHIEVMASPTHQRLDPVSADITIFTVVFCGACDAETILPQAAGDDLGLLIQQTDPGGVVLAFLSVQMHGNGIAFDGINIDAITKLRSDS